MTPRTTQEDLSLAWTALSVLGDRHMALEHIEPVEGPSTCWVCSVIAKGFGQGVRKHAITIEVPSYPITPRTSWKASCSGCDWRCEGVFGNNLDGNQWRELHLVETGVEAPRRPVIRAAGSVEPS
jgi:hypothetical protein